MRAAIYILYKTGFVSQQQQQDDEPILIAILPESEQVMSKKVDKIMTHRLVSICQFQNVPFIPELVTPLLTYSYTKEQFKTLIENAQNE